MRLASAFLLVSSCLPAWAGEGFAGRRLADVLEDFRAGGLAVLYSSAVVTRDLVVTVEPSSADPREALAQILTPLQLEVRDGPAGVVVIARAPPREEAAPIGLTGFTTEVVVTPGRHTLLDSDGEATRRADREDLLRVPEIGGDVSRQVERLPGIAAADNSALFHARGSLDGDTSMVFDGLELYVPYHLTEFQAPFSLIDSRLTERLELRNGGFTVDRGDRHGAFLDVDTVVPSTLRGDVELGTMNSRASFGTPLAGGTGSFLASARSWYPEAFLDTLELGAGERLRPRFTDVYVKGGWSPTPGAFLSAHVLLARDRLRWEERGEIDREVVDAEAESAAVWIRFLAASAGGVTTETVLSGGWIDENRAGIAVPDDGVVAVDDEREMGFFGLTEDVSWSVGRSQRLRAGFSVRDLAADYRYRNEFAGDPGSDTSILTSPQGSSWGAYVSDRFLVSPSLAFEAGLRWDRQDYTRDDQWGPRIHLVWDAGNAGEFRLAAGRYAQSQRIYELRVEDGETAFHPAEISLQAEGTYVRRFPSGVRLRVDAYAHRITGVRPRYENLVQPLDLFPETSEDRVAVAPSRARLRGIEILVSGDPDLPVLWWASYTRSTAEDLVEGTWVPRSWDQPHAGKFLVGYRWGDAWLVSLAGSMHTGWPSTPVSAIGVEQPDGSVEVETEYGTRNSIRFPGYRRLDLKVRRSFATGRGPVSLTLDILNVTDRKNVCCVDDLVVSEPVPGPIDARVEYGSWLGITPTLQVRWEF